MKENHMGIIRSVFRILLSVSIIVAGLCLIYGCLCIYYSQDHSYSLQAVRENFAKIAVPVYICAGLCAVSIVSSLLFPASEKSKAKSNPRMRLSVLLSKKDLSSADTLNAINAERKKQRLYKALCLTLTGLLSCVFLIYAFNPQNYHTSLINQSMIKAMAVLAPCALGMLVVAFITEHLTVKSIGRMIDTLKALPNSKAEAESLADEKPRFAGKLNVIRFALLVICIGFMVYGLINGGVYDVLTKAVNICTECIGLG